MSWKTIWEWIISNGWPSRTPENLAVKYYSENLQETLTHPDISTLANEVNGMEIMINERSFYV